MEWLIGVLIGISVLMVAIGIGFGFAWVLGAFKDDEEDQQ